MMIPSGAMAHARKVGLGESAAMYHWEQFEVRAEEYGISLEHPDDWFESWTMWVQAAAAELARDK